MDCSTRPVLLFVPHARGPAYEKFMRALMGLDVSNGPLLRTGPANCNTARHNNNCWKLYLYLWDRIYQELNKTKYNSQKHQWGSTILQELGVSRAEATIATFHQLSSHSTPPRRSSSSWPSVLIFRNKTMRVGNIFFTCTASWISSAKHISQLTPRYL